MDLERELDAFLESNEKAFLLRGKWGVGKTTAVDNWVKAIKSEEIDWKPIHLSLFGVSDVNDLNTRLIRESSLLGKIGKHSDKMGVKVSAEYYAGVSFSLSGLFDVLAEANFEKEQKKRKWCGKSKITKYVIILDDIERKDFKLSLDQIFGFIDQINPNRSKIIAITNSDRFEDDLDFYYFKEKVFDREFYLDRPTPSLKRQLFGNDSLFDKLRISEIDNLRTIMRCKNAIESSGIKNDSVGLIRMYAIVRALDSIDNNKFGKEAATRKFLNDTERLTRISNPDSSFDRAQSEQDYTQKHKEFTKSDYFAEIFEDKGPFDCVANRSEFLSAMYQLTDGLKYEPMRDVRIVFSSSPYPSFALNLDFSEFKNGNSEYINEIIDAIDAAIGAEIEEASLFYELCKAGYYLSLSPKIEAILSRFEKVLSKTIKWLSKRLIEAQYWWGNKLDSFYLDNFVGKAEAYEAYLKLLKQAVIRDALERFATVDAFPTAESKDRATEIFHFTNYDPNKNEAEFTDFVNAIVYSYVERLAQEGESYITFAFSFLYDTQFDKAIIRRTIDERMASNVPKAIKKQLNLINRQYFA